MPSTVIKSYHYNQEKKKLTILFVTGIRYEYSCVPPQVYEAFVRATSKGTFFNSKIRNNYPFQKLGDKTGWI